MENFMIEMPAEFGNGIMPGDLLFEKYCVPNGVCLTPYNYVDEFLVRLLEYSVIYEKWVAVSSKAFSDSIYQERLDYIKKKEEFEKGYKVAMEEYKQKLDLYEQSCATYQKKKLIYDEECLDYFKLLDEYKKDFRRQKALSLIQLGFLHEPQEPQKPIPPEIPVPPQKPQSRFDYGIKTHIHDLPELLYEAFLYFEEQRFEIPPSVKFLEIREVDSDGEKERFLFPTEALISVFPKKKWKNNPEYFGIFIFFWWVCL